MKKNSIIDKLSIFSVVILFFSISVLFPACKKESPAPIIPTDLTPKQLESITQEGKLLYEFNYQNDVLEEYVFHGDPYHRTEFINGKIYRKYDESGNFLIYEYNWNWIYVYSNLDPDTRLESYEYGWDNRLKSVTIHLENTDDIKYRYEYLRDNLKKIIVMQGTGDDKHLKTFYLTFDKSPNPWYGLGIIDDFAALSENNYIEINSYPWASYEYDEQGYMIQSDIHEQGVYKYHYK